MARSIRPAIAVATLLVAVGGIAHLPVTAAPPSARAVPVRAPANERAEQAQRLAQAPADRFIVRFHKDAPERRDAAARQRLLDRVGQRQGVRLSHGRALAVGADLLRTDRKLDVHAAKRLQVELLRDPRVAAVEVDRLHTPQSLPNDPLLAWYMSQGYDTIPAGHAAWNRSLGQGALIAVLDTGMTAHPDLAPNVLPGYDFITDPNVAGDGNGRDSDPADPGDFVAAEACFPGSAAQDSSWHGTQVAGAAAARGNNGVGTAGVAYQSGIVPVRVLGKCGGWTSDIADAIVWAAGGSVPGVPANGSPAEVINLSFARTGGCGAATQAAIDTAVGLGAVVVAAAGDQFAVADNQSPAGCANVVVAGTSFGDYSWAGPSNYGPAVDVTGPGAANSTYFLAPTTGNAGTSVPGSPSYLYAAGSSMSAAVVSGTVALMQSINPHSPALVESMLRHTARPLQQPCPHDVPAPLTACGAGHVDIDAATLAASTPMLAILDPAAHAEGHGGSTTLEFTVALTEPIATPVTFSVAAIAGTATGGSDYSAAFGTQTLPAGATTKTLSVTIHGDTAGELDEDFRLVLGNVTGATLGDGDARGVIANDDLVRLERGVGAFVPNPPGASQHVYFFVVPEDAAGITVDTEGFGGDVDLYVRKGAVPTRTEYDCASTAVGNTEHCALGEDAGTYYVLADVLSNPANAQVTASWHGLAKLRLTEFREFESNPGEGDPVFHFELQRLTLADQGLPVGACADGVLAACDGPVSFDVATADLTASAGSDYDAVSIVGATMAADEWSYHIQVTVHSDTLLEPNEAFQVVVDNLVGGEVVRGTGLGEIQNDDGPVLSTNAYQSVPEEDVDQTWWTPIQLNAPLDYPVTFDVVTRNGTAVAGLDYVAATTPVTIPAGETFMAFPVTIKGDQLAEGRYEFEREEHLFLDIVNVTPGVTLQWGNTIRFAIEDDDEPQLTIDNVSVTEGNAGTKVATFLVKLPQALEFPVHFTVSTDGGSATPGEDYVPLYFEGTIPAGMTSQAVGVAIKGDTAVEGNQNIQLWLGEVPAASVIILNDDGPTLSIADAFVGEGASGTKSMYFTLALSQPATVPVSFDIFTTAGGSTAIAGVDYIAVDLQGQTIPAGQKLAQVVVPIIGDTAVEANETFRVLVDSTAGASTLDGEAIGTILNDDGPTVSIADVAMAEGNSGTQAMTFTVALSKVSASPVTFNVATVNGTAIAGNDYVGIAPTAQSIPAGQLTKTFTVTISGDTTLEPNETFKVNLGNVSGATVFDGQAIGTLLNDEGPTLSVADLGLFEGDAGTKLAVFVVRLSQASATPVTFNFATQNYTALNGSDYVGRTLTGLVIPAGQLSKTVQVTVNGDTSVEANEAFFGNITAGSVSAMDAQAMATVFNDDGPTLSITDAQVTEGHSGTKLMTFTVQLTQAGASAVTYTLATANGTASGVSDYVQATINDSIPAGMLSKTFSVTIKGDTTVEANETFKVNVSNASVSLTDGQGIGTIVNDD
jgi:serine protease